MKFKKQDIIIFFIIIGLIGFGYYLFTIIKSEGGVCVNDPLTYSYHKLQDKNIDSVITINICKQSSCTNYVINESGTNLVNNKPKYLDLYILK